MEKIENPGEYLVVEANGFEWSAVYSGPLTELTPVELKWRKEKVGEEEQNVLTLSEIAEQTLGKVDICITVFTESTTGGCILRCGNSGSGWWLVGELYGYA